MTGTGDRGEATIALAILGAVATAAPFAVEATSNATDNNVVAAGAVVGAAVAIGTGVGKLWMRRKRKDDRDEQVYRAIFGETDANGHVIDEGMVTRLKRVDATTTENGATLTDHLRNHS